MILLSWRPDSRLIFILAKYWRGEYPASISFFAVFAALGISLFLASRWILNSQALVENYAWQLTLLCISLLAMFPILFCLGVGAWRACKAELTLAVGVRTARIGMRIGIALGSFWWGRQLVLSSIDVYSMLESIITASTRYSISISTQSTHTLRFNGELAWGSAKSLAQELDLNKNIRIIEINSRGGSLAEAEKIASLIQAMQLQTFVRGECHSACTLVFAAGSSRKATHDAKFAFHRPATGSILTSNRVVEKYARRYEQYLLRQNVDSRFVDQAMAVYSPQFWVPDNRDLRLSGFVQEFVDE